MPVFWETSEGQWWASRGCPAGAWPHPQGGDLGAFPECWEGSVEISRRGKARKLQPVTGGWGWRQGWNRVCSGQRDRKYKGMEVAEGQGRSGPQPGRGGGRGSPSGRVKEFGIRPAPGSWGKNSHTDMDKTPQGQNGEHSGAGVDSGREMKQGSKWEGLGGVERRRVYDLKTVCQGGVRKTEGSRMPALCLGPLKGPGPSTERQW